MATRSNSHIRSLAVVDYAAGAPAMYAVHSDHLGTPRIMSDASGAEVWHIDARPFGETVAITGTAANDNRFPGQVFDGESGLHYNYFRDYDPTLGRYLQSDPIGLRGGLNTYAYVGGNPVRAVDPLGLDFAISVDPNAAGGNGHTTLFFQDGQGNWHSYDQGAAGETSSGGNVGFLTGSNAPAGVGISRVSALPQNALVFPSSGEEDLRISQCAIASQQSHISGKDQYNLYSNNCTDAAVDVLGCAGIKVYNPPFTVRPNSWVGGLPENPPSRK